MRKIAQLETLQLNLSNGERMSKKLNKLVPKLD